MPGGSPWDSWRLSSIEGETNAPERSPAKLELQSCLIVPCPR
jgi:hypothetical protein